MTNVIIADPEALAAKKAKLKQGGSNNLQVIADFDKTLTQAFIGGTEVHSTYAFFRNGKYLTPDYVKKSHEMFEHYHPSEVDVKLSLEERKAEMIEWWSRHLQLLIDSGLTKQTILDIVNNEDMRLRKGGSDFFVTLKSKEIPLLIFSAGVGDIIRSFLEKEKLCSDNVHLISNFFVFEDDKVIGYKENIIHVLNKNETSLEHTPYYSEAKGRRNVILIGDNIGDSHMSDGIPHDTIIKIGFLNKRVDEFKEAYSKAFDVVITDDGDMEFVNSLLKDIVG